MGFRSAPDRHGNGLGPPCLQPGVCSAAQPVRPGCVEHWAAAQLAPDLRLPGAECSLALAASYHTRDGFGSFRLPAWTYREAA